VAPDSREAAELVEVEDNPETKPASAAACPKARAGTPTRMKITKEPNTSFVLSIDIPLQRLQFRVISKYWHALTLFGSVASKSTLEAHSELQNYSH
jgi:hypothetical protein